MSEEVKKKGLFSRLFKGSVYEEEPTGEGAEVSEVFSEKPSEKPLEEPSEKAGPLADESTESAAAESAAEKSTAEEAVEVPAQTPGEPAGLVEALQDDSSIRTGQAVEVAEAALADDAEPETVVAEDSEKVPPAGEARAEPSEEARKEGFFGRLRNGLSKTRGSLAGKLDRALFGKKVVDEETLEELEEALITADIGVNTAMRLVAEVSERVSRKELTDPEALRQHLKKRIGEILIEDEGHFTLGETRPYVVLVIGVNGVGKTTTIAKIAARHIKDGRKVVIGAADTFRAAAIEQLCVWGERVGAKVVHHQHGSDPAAVAYDTLEAAKARGADLVLIDTAGRLHTKTNLMEEMKKIRRVVGNAVEGAPHEVMLVLDSTTGQNAINQAIQFRDTVGVDSIALTKLDGTAKGGVIVGICDELKIPVKFIGIGEQVDDLRPFEATQFIEALF